VLDVPNDMFGKVMSVPDSLITDYFVHCTRVPMTDIATIAEEMVMGGNPRDAKVLLAKEIVRLYHGDTEADKAEQYFVDTFSKGHIPQDVAVTSVNSKFETIVDTIVAMKFATSKSDALRKIEQGGVSVDGVKISPDDIQWDKEKHEEKVMKVGKKDFVKITFAA
jgi:tyrosyl-tRNA synthetase